MTTKQAADRLSCSKSMIRKMAGQGTLSGFRVGRDWRFDADAVDKMAKVSSVVQDAVSKVAAVAQDEIAEIAAVQQQALADQVRTATESALERYTATLDTRLAAISQELRELRYEVPRAGGIPGWATYPYPPNGGH